MFSLASFLNILKLAPYVVEGIESIHSEASTATKQQLATDSLSLAAGVAGAIDPAASPVIAAASAGIQSIVSAIFSVKAAASNTAPMPTVTVSAPTQS